MSIPAPTTPNEPAKKKSLKFRLVSTGLVVAVIVGVAVAAVVPGMQEDATQDRILSYGATEAGHPVEIEKVKKSGKSFTSRYVIYEFTVDGSTHQVRGEEVGIGTTVRLLPDRVVYYNPEKPEESFVSLEDIPGTGGSDTLTEITENLGDMNIPDFDEQVPDVDEPQDDPAA